MMLSSWDAYLRQKNHSGANRAPSPTWCPGHCASSFPLLSLHHQAPRHAFHALLLPSSWRLSGALSPSGPSRASCSPRPCELTGEGPRILSHVCISANPLPPSLFTQRCMWENSLAPRPTALPKRGHTGHHVALSPQSRTSSESAKLHRGVQGAMPPSK